MKNLSLWTGNSSIHRKKYILRILFRLAKEHEPTSSLDEENIDEFWTCQTYISSRVYNNVKPTQDELTYPVAYSIVVHANFGQVERLIRAIWRPQEWLSSRMAEGLRVTKKIWNLQWSPLPFDHGNSPLIGEFQSGFYIFLRRIWLCRIISNHLAHITVTKLKHMICLHIDKKAEKKFFDAMQNLTSCFSNIFLAKKREDVIYGHYSRLQVEIQDMNDCNYQLSFRQILIVLKNCSIEIQIGNILSIYVAKIFHWRLELKLHLRWK